MNFHRTLCASLIGLNLAIGAALATPNIAFADTGSDVAIGAALGAITGALLLDGGRNQYYYVHDGRRHYVDHRTAGWYHQYGGYHGWQSHHDGYRHDHGGYGSGGYGHGGYDHGHGDYDHGHDHSDHDHGGNWQHDR